MTVAQTNIRIDSTLMQAVKARAVAEDTSMRDVIERALRDFLSASLAATGEAA